MKRGLLWASILGVLAIASCESLDEARRGFPVGAEKLRSIEESDLAALSTAAPTTLPATRAATLPATLPASAPPAEILLSIEQCRQQALANNLDLRVELFNPTMTRQALSEEEARYEMVFTANATYAVTDSATFTKLNNAQSKSFSAGAGMRIPLRTGGEIRFDLPVSRFETNNEFSTLNPAYTSDFSASISHPLMRGAGLAVNAIPLKIATYNYQSAQAQTKLAIIRVLADIERIYWRLYASRLDLDVRKKEYDLAVAQLDRARRQFKAGAVPEVDVVRAESGVADRIEAIIAAETAVRDRQREMKRVLNRPDAPLSSETILVPMSRPDARWFKLDSALLVKTAMDKRMELLESELQIAQQAAGIDQARNDLLPLVTLDYTYGVNGLGTTLPDSFQMLKNKKFEDHRVGLSIQMPLGNEAARSRLRRALAGRLQSLTSKENRIAIIEKEVLDAADHLEANWQRILAAQRRVVLAARLVDQEIRQYQVGARTSTDVLDAQARLTSAQTAEIAALVEYQISQIDVAFATGMLLGRSRINWEAAPTPKL